MVIRALQKALQSAKIRPIQPNYDRRKPNVTRPNTTPPDQPNQ
jgi:hypothetical protein